MFIRTLLVALLLLSSGRAFANDATFMAEYRKHLEREKNNPSTKGTAQDPIIIDKIEGDKAYDEYQKIIALLNAKIMIAQDKTKNIKKMAEEEFNKNNLDRVKELSYYEMKEYPVLFIDGFIFRIYKPFIFSKDEETREQMKKEFYPEMYANRYLRPQISFSSGDDPFKYFRNQIKNNNFELVKVLPKDHLCLIKNSGLDSKFGGVGGASDIVSGFQGLKSTHDRGRMFFGTSPSSDYNAGYAQKNIEKAIILVKIPKDKTAILNLIGEPATTEWFIAGTTIEPEYIYLLDEKNNQKSIKDLACPDDQILTTSANK